MIFLCQPSLPGPPTKPADALAPQFAAQFVPLTASLYKRLVKIIQFRDHHDLLHKMVHKSLKGNVVSKDGLCCLSADTSIGTCCVSGRWVKL